MHYIRNVIINIDQAEFYPKEAVANLVKFAIPFIPLIKKFITLRFRKDPLDIQRTYLFHINL